MADRQKSHFGTDGYKELYLKQNAMKARKLPRNSELMKLKSEEMKKKKLSSRAAKYLHPKGTGKRNIGEFR
jgi:hypothetical protein